MFNHQKYLDTFLNDYRVNRFTNDSVAKIDRVIVVSCYRLIGIHHLTPPENVGKRNLFMDVVDTNGNRLIEKIEWGWEGQRSNQHPNPVVLDKPLSEPSGNISIDFGQKIWAQVLNKPSDKVYNITTQLPDEGQGNTLGHHSYYIVWAWAEGESPPPPPPVYPPPNLPYEQGFKDGVKFAKHKLTEALDKLD